MGGDASTGAALKHLFSSYLVVLFVCIPIAWGLQAAGASPTLHFVFNFGAIVPLSWLISEATDNLEGIVGRTAGVLLNSTFGNMVEIILSVTAIRAGLVKVVQSSLLGAMLMNLLFVTGCCFLVAGIRAHEQAFNPNAVSYALGLLAVSMLALLVPSELAVTDEWSLPNDRLTMSRFVALLLGAMYIQWLIFNMCTHSALFESNPNEKKMHKVAADDDGDARDFHGHTTTVYTGAGYMSSQSDDEDESDEDEPKLPGWLACSFLLFATVLVSFHCDWLVESIEPVTKQLGIHEAFVATVLLPMVGNFSEEIAALNLASKGKLDLAMGVAIGSATQIAMLVVPVVVFLGWYLGQPFDLDFEVLQCRLLLASLLVAALCLRDPEANWLKGSMLVTAYIIISTAFWWMCDEEFHSAGAKRPFEERLKEAAEVVIENVTANLTAVGH